MRKLLLMAAIVCSLTLPTADAADAMSTYVDDVKAAYPTATNLANCGTCHKDFNDYADLNVYGQQLTEAVGDTTAARLQAIENLDADGDGVSNIDEILTKAGFFPGYSCLTYLEATNAPDKLANMVDPNDVGCDGPGTTTTLMAPTTTSTPTTTTVSTTSTMPPGPDCGDPTDDDKITATDALYVLRTAVGLLECELDLCDFNGDNRISAVDAFGVLRTAVGLATSPDCGGFGRAATTSSSVFVVDSLRKKAYVPLPQAPDPETGHGRVAIVNVAADPDKTDPRRSVVMLSHGGKPSGTAIDVVGSKVFVISGEDGVGGFIDIIDSATDSLTADSPIALPDGLQPGEFGQAVFDPSLLQLIVSVRAAAPLTPVSPLCEVTPSDGFVLFDPATRGFGTFIPTNYAETFAFNPKTGRVLAGSECDADDEVSVVDFGLQQNFLMADSNLGKDHDGASIDFGTNVTLIANDNGTATIINLGDLVAEKRGGQNRLVHRSEEPNSVLLTGLPTGASGSAINLKTHTAFLIEGDRDGLALIDLPVAPVGQLTPDMVGMRVSKVPVDPQGNSWATQDEPYAVAMDARQNVGYALSKSGKWLMGVDLRRFRKNPKAIKSPLPSGTCKGLNTSLSCSNKRGIRFIPLPPASE